MPNGDASDRQTVHYGDECAERGYGGETHQVAGDGTARLTTQQGVVVDDDQNTLRAGQRGPGMLEDFHFRERIFHFDHERIPERVVHARGYGAHGYFENYEPLTDLTRADVFSEAGLRTPAFVRFSTVAGNKGSADLARDVRGFAVKLYTREGNWDLVGNNIPVFFIHVVPGIDFTNDPLLQGRNFSYLDTQLKRLGSPNFPHLPINAPKCPVAHFQQDGHMAMTNPATRANYEPNSWGPAVGGPRETRPRASRHTRTPTRPVLNPVPSGGSVPKASPITTARPASSGSARPRPSSGTSSTPSCSS